MVSENLIDLMRSPGHWEFEIFLMLLFDGIIAGLLFPFVRKHWRHHIARDRAESTAFNIPEYTDWRGTEALWPTGSMKSGETVGVKIDWSGSHPQHVLFSNASDDDPERWPDPGTERCMECLGLIDRIDEHAARCKCCGTINPMISYGYWDAAI